MTKAIVPSVNKDFSWKMTNLWYIPFFIPTFFFTSFGLLYAGLAVKKAKWIRTFAATFGLTALTVSMILAEQLQGLMAFLFFANWIFTIAYLLKTSREFLYRLDIRQHEEEIFDMAKIRIDNDVKSDPGDELALQFISGLHKWHREIDSLPMKKNIQNLIEISSVVAKRKNKDSERFFMRYNDSLNSLLKQYDEIENNKLNTEAMRETMRNIESGFGQIVSAFKKEAESMYKYDVVNLNAETAAFLQDLRNRGLLDDANK
jgi:hypothetical protein